MRVRIIRTFLSTSEGRAGESRRRKVELPIRSGEVRFSRRGRPRLLGPGNPAGQHNVAKKIVEGSFALT